MRDLVLIREPGETPLTRLLHGLGAVFKTIALEELADGMSSLAAGGERGALIITEEQLVQALQLGRARNTKLPQLFSPFALALVFPLRGTAAGAQALTEWAGVPIEVKPLDASMTERAVARVDLCGPFAGLPLGATNGTNEVGLFWGDASGSVERLVSAGPLSLFARVRLPATELFVASASAVFDVEAEVNRNLAAAECFSGLVPLVLFLRHSGVTCWRAPRCGANLIIDDPNLRPDYGFVNLPSLARKVDELGCAVSIGFIPWNFKRTSPGMVELFRSHWPRLSLSVHGCDHTRSEFSTKTVSQAHSLIALGLDRMSQFSARTGLGYDKAMVFPQGVFSAAAMHALRQSPFLGAVNTELMDRQANRGVRAGEWLMPAICSYAGFPLFLRRKAEEPIANFALDLLLGKPCLIVTHHDYFRLGLEPMAALVRALNALHPALGWTNLESIVSTTLLLRSHADNTKELRLFSAATTVTAQETSGAVRCSKVEPLAQAPFQVLVDGQPEPCTAEDGLLSFTSPLPAGKPVKIQVIPPPAAPIPALARPFKQRARIAARRLLSEFRDNHVAKSAWATAALNSARSLLRKPRAGGPDCARD